MIFSFPHIPWHCFLPSQTMRLDGPERMHQKRETSFFLIVLRFFWPGRASSLYLGH